MSLVSSPEIKDSSWCQCSSTFLNGRILNFCPFLLLFPADKIHKCHSMRHSTLLLSKQMLYNSVSGLFIYILGFFPSSFRNEKRVWHGDSDNTRYAGKYTFIDLSYEMLGDSIQKQTMASLYDNRTPTHRLCSSASRKPSTVSAATSPEQPGLSICQLPSFLLLLSTHNQSEKHTHMPP